MSAEDEDHGEPDTASNRVVICVATRNRQVGLRRLLESLCALEPPEVPWRVIVVDNASEHPAAATTAEFEGPLDIVTVTELRRGIPFARNAALDRLDDRDLALFVDDDEVVSPGWLNALYHTMVQYDADAVAGPVITELEQGATAWTVDAGFFAYTKLPTGTVRTTAATNNVLVRVAALRRLGLRFDERYPLLGGSDSWLFARLHIGGGHIVWCQEATVHETIPLSRARPAWLVRRAFRGGYAPSLRRAAERPRSRSIAIEIGRAFFRFGDGMRLLILAPLRGRAGLLRAAQRIASGVGTVWAIAGGSFHEYLKTD